MSYLNRHAPKIPKYTNYPIQPTVKEIPIFVQDTTYFPRKVEAIKK